MAEALEQEIDRNFDFFLRHLNRYLPDHLGQFALLKNCQVIDFFGKLIEAERVGNQRFPDGIYSIQEVTDNPVDLGYMNYAIDSGVRC